MTNNTSGNNKNNSMKNKSSKDYDVGYGKPPKHSQFKPGQSGNKKGRPNGSRNIKTDFKEISRKRVRMEDNKNSKTITTQQAALLKLTEGALKGDIRKLDKFIQLCQTYNNEQENTEQKKLAKNDKDILKAYLEKHLNKDQVNKETDIDTNIDTEIDDDEEWLK